MFTYVNVNETGEALIKPAFKIKKVRGKYRQRITLLDEKYVLSKNIFSKSISYLIKEQNNFLTALIRHLSVIVSLKYGNIYEGD